MCVCGVSYIDGEVAWGAADVAGGGQGLGDVLQAEGSGQDLEGQPDHQVALGALERPAVPWVHIRLVWEEGEDNMSERPSNQTAPRLSGQPVGFGGGFPHAPG